MKSFFSSIFGKRLPIHWKVTVIGEVPLDTVKSLIVENWDEYPTVWQAYDIEEMRNRLQSARTTREVICVFGPDY